MRIPARISGVEGRTRLRVLAAVRSAAGPMRVDELAEQLALHPNTVRFHLETLQSDGTVERSEQHHGGRGRPSAVYTATAQPGSLGHRDPVLLSRILVEGAESRAADGDHSEVWEAGRRWGEKRCLGAGSSDIHEAIARHLDQTGFAPGAARPDDDGSGRTRISLLNCAFADLADTQQASVCALHAGMLEGVRQAVDTHAAWDVELRPFVTPSVCEVTICCRRAASDR
ncbi:helix-turn-helix domain-containing protein [Dietzia sp. ANT_WB102]|nr:helix-turn-helix domain-containing protein [Dietzia sp. ANT_WB102]